MNNLAWATTSEDLQQAFSTYGATSGNVAVRKDGRSRGWGTVQFSTSEEADSAIAGMKGYNLGGRELEVLIDKKA